MTNSEHSIAQAEASIMMYDEPKKRWQPLLPGNTLSEVNVTHHITSNTFKIVGRSLSSNDVIISCNIVKNLKYNQATATFHQWRDQKTIFGLNFPTVDDADNFALGIRNALEILSRDVPAHITQQMPPPSQPPALPPRKNSSPQVLQMLEPKYINVDDNIIEKIREKDNAMTQQWCSGGDSSNENSIYDPVMVSSEHSRDMYLQNGSTNSYSTSATSSQQQTHHRAGSYNRNQNGSSANLGISQYGDDADDRVSIYSTSTNSSSSSGAGNQHSVEQYDQQQQQQNGSHHQSSGPYALSSAAFPPPQSIQSMNNAGHHYRGSSGGSTGAAEAAKYVHPPPSASAQSATTASAGPIPPLPPQPPPPAPAPSSAPIPPPPPPPADRSPESEAPQSSFAAMLAGVKLKKAKQAEDATPSLTPSGTLRSSVNLSGPPSTPKTPAAPSGGGGGGMGLMSEMSALLAKRKQMSEGDSGAAAPGSVSGHSTLKSSSESKESNSGPGASHVPVGVGSLSRRKSLTPAENLLSSNSSSSNPGSALSVHSTTPSAANVSCANTTTSASSTSANVNAVSKDSLESLKQEILTAMRAEIQAAKNEILQAIRAQNR